MVKKRLIFMVACLAAICFTLALAETDFEDVDKFRLITKKQRIKHKQRRGHRLRHRNKQTIRLISELSSDSQPIGGSVGGGAWPATFNVADKAAITSNATCGENSREDYCKIIDARPHKSRSSQSQCGTCDVNSAEVDRRHLIEYAVDGTPKWWQSPTLQQGMHNEYVTITMDLGQIYQVTDIQLKASNSPRPAAWILEKSLDGDLFVPWQFFATSEDDCIQRYGVPAQEKGYEFKDDAEVICSVEFSKPTPLENGKVQVSLMNGRPGDALELLDFTIARYIRLRFQGMHMTQPGSKWPFSAENLFKRSFYSLRHIKIDGRCVCNGHAAKCKINDNDTEPYPKCECLHNTCGDHCEKCCPMYNQRQYRHGSPASENRCEKCQCNGHASECRYSADIDERGLSMNAKGKMSGGGVCMNCTDFTTGVNCEKCMPGYFRPHAVPTNAPEPCIPCDCHDAGVEGHCMSVGGECMCKEGYMGARCDQCAPGYRGPNCLKCGCDPRGTMQGGECESHCLCKLYVEGENCDQCVQGYFGLSADNPEGCTKCFCSGVSSTCQSWRNVKVALFESYENWTVTDITNTESKFPSTDLPSGFLFFEMSEFDEIQAVFWSAPESYLGNKLTSYGSNFVFKVKWVVVRGDTSGKPTTSPNLILIGRNGMKIAFGDQKYTGTNATIDVRLIEDGWYHVPKTVADIVTSRQRRTEYKGDPVTRVQFMSILSDLEAMLLRGSFHTDQADCYLLKSILYVGGNAMAVDQGESLVEQCDCPSGYSGNSCETCTFGFVRVYENSTAHEKIAKCMTCNCNGHAETCDLLTGACGPCHHNTEGDQCERCKDGFYGVPNGGTDHDCKPCACPLTASSNSFSPSCRLKLDSEDVNHVQKNWYAGIEVHEYVCTACPDGYIGDHCELCADGYFGQPTEIGSQCLPCPCNGGPCDPVTGRCITCQGNTEGWRCERCKTGYWGNAVEGCHECECYDHGSIDGLCDAKTGQCKCRERYAGLNCQKCDLGFANLSEDCAPCNCHENGSTSHVCDPDTGLCECRDGVYGGKCDLCRDEFFNLTQTGCEGCNCHIHGSKDRNCDHRTGQCNCHPHTTGRRCHNCEHGYWNIDSKKGCEPCTCNQVGSIDIDCDDFTGECKCKPGVTGLHCDHCASGYFGFSTAGCKKCETCESPAFICDPDTGKCICPPLSQGADCGRCVANSWGWEYQRGCKYCQCDRVGSIGQICDNTTGQCECKEGFAGLKCNQCASGYYNYPDCKRCDCDPRGVQDGNFNCDDFGQCSCKDLVTGRRCNRCRQATFGLQAYNPLGCSRCFCFGRSQDCYESTLTWGQLRLQGSRNLSVEYVAPYETDQKVHDYVVVYQLEGTKLHREAGEIKHMNGLPVIPSSTGNVSIGSYGTFAEPLYLQLPQHFLGDQTKSYGGMLKFTIVTEGDAGALAYSILRDFPLVQIHSHHSFILNYYGPEILETSANHTFAVRLFEEHWKYHHDGQEINRAIFMTALENIKHIFIRATASIDFTEVVISNVTMDTALFIEGSNNNLATSVEVCQCPRQFGGLSCQAPSDGFYRWRSQNHSDLLEDLVGHVLPCSCNERSDVCDKETGHCINCTENTGGSSCEVCAEGFYGDPNYGSCQACPCPEARKNFARGCLVQGNDVRCICKYGYTGRLCEECINGFFGNPEREDGSCQSCDCNPDGIEEEGCDMKTGQCRCKPNITGRKCDKCELPRTYLQDGHCQLCDNCTMTLMDTIDEIRFQFEQETDRLDFHGIPAPWLKLDEYANLTNHLNDKYMYFDDAKYRIETFDENNLEKLSAKASNVESKSSKLPSKAKKILVKSEKLRDATSRLVKDIRNITDQVTDTIAELNTYGTREEHIQLPKALEEATQIRDELQTKYDAIISLNATALQCATKHSLMWQNISLNVNNQNAKLMTLNENIEDFAAKINDLRKKAMEIHDTSKDLDKMFKNGTLYIDLITQKYKQIDEMLSDVREIFSDSLNADSDVFLKMFQENLKKVDEDVQLIGTWRNDLDDILVENSDLLNDARTFDLPRAKDHAHVLDRRAKQYEGLYEGTKRKAADAMSAIQAYQNISDSIETAKHLATQAFKAANLATQEIYPESGESIIARGVSSFEESKRVRDSIKREMDRVTDLHDTMEYHQRQVSNLNNTIWQCAVKEGKISAALNGYIQTAGKNEDMLTASEVSDKVSNEMREIHKNAINIDRDIYKLKNKLSTLKPDWEVEFGGAEENLTFSLKNTRTANTHLTDIEDKIKEQNRTFAEWNESFSRKIQALRDQIALAKHTAEGVHIAVGSEHQSCIRSYMPKSIGPTTSTHIVVTFAMKKKATNSSLVFLKGEEKNFIALEIVDRKVRFLWNLGNDTKIITHPTKIIPKDSRFDDAWYKVVASRVMNFGSLTVRQMKGSGSAYMDGTTETAASSVESSRFTMDEMSRIWVGGVDKFVRPVELDAADGLNVVLHQLNVDEKEIGLWRFETSTGDCKGAIVGPQETGQTDNSRHFNGHGYAVLQSNPRAVKRETFDVRMTFKTLDEKALLFLAIDPNTNGSVSLSLYEGKVIFRVDYDNDSWLELNGTETINTGKWVTVNFARHFEHQYDENGQLVVNTKILNGSPNRPIDFSKVPNLLDTNYYIGGVPPGFNAKIARRLDSPFLGCIREIQIGTEARDPIEDINFYGVEPSCRSTISKVGFPGDGYVELPSHSLRRRANFGFVFRTLKPNCLLLLAAHPPHIESDSRTAIGNYSVTLVDGKVNVKIDAGQGAILLTSNLTLNDGDYHVVSVAKIRKKFELRINDDLQSWERLSMTVDGVNLPEHKGGLYIGGAPKIPEFVNLASLESFEGAIKDVVFNNRSISFDQQLTFENVEFGRDGPDMGTHGMMIMKTEPHGRGYKTEGCSRVGSYSYEPNGFKFGDGQNSHSEIKIPTRNMWQRNFTVQFDVRTFYPNGIFFAAPGTKEKQKHFVLLAVRDGFITLILRGRKKQNLSVPVRINDGHWYRVSLVSKARKATLSVARHRNGAATNSTQIRLPKRLNASNKIFIGGLPEEGLALPPELISKLEGFKGCLKRFVVNNITQDLAKQNSHVNVGQCFPRVEKGSYFPGDAYAIYKRNFNVGKVLELQIKFKTSEMNGILLSVSDRDGFPALSLEINSGNIVFSCDLGDGIPLRAVKTMDSKFALCDNRWHTVDAFYDSEQIFVKVDNYTSVQNLASNRIGRLQTKSPLFIGGLPETAPQGTLLSRENFKGCINNVIIRNEIRDWTDYDRLHNVLLNECPATA